MGQVFQNLIMNAINYSGEKSDIVVRFSNVDANVLVEVEDNGLGIEETHLRRLFERFYRIDKSIIYKSCILYMPHSSFRIID